MLLLDGGGGGGRSGGGGGGPRRTVVGSERDIRWKPRACTTPMFYQHT